MKKLVLVDTLLFGGLCAAQEVHFTIYNFTVEPQNVSTIYQLCEEYFSKNKPEGVTVSLYENHFNDASNNFSHSIVFSGSLDAMGNMYSGENDDTWTLFITRVNQQIKDGFSSAMGRRLLAYGEDGEMHRFQRYYLLNVDEPSKWMDSYKKMMEKNNPAGRVNLMGNYSVGHGPDGANVWILNCFKDFKTAMAGVGSLRSEAQKEASSKAWDKHREERGEVKMVRSGMRILLNTW
jgi:hypothetical protein